MSAAPAIGRVLRSRGGGRQRGLTLVELLVALVLLSFLLAAVYGALRVGLRSWDAVQARTAATAEARVARNFIRDQFAHLVALRWAGDDKGDRLAFEGDEHGVRFVAGLEHVPGGGGLYLVDLRSRAPATGGSLQVRYQRSALAGDRRWQRTVGSPLERALEIGGVGLRFDYYGSPDGETAPRWHGRWSARAVEFPQWIRIEPVAATAGPWPPLVLAIGMGRPTTGGG